MSKSLATACTSAWVQMQFSFLHNEAEVCHNQALQKNYIGLEYNHQHIYPG